MDKFAEIGLCSCKNLKNKQKDRKNFCLSHIISMPGKFFLRLPLCYNGPESIFRWVTMKGPESIFRWITMKGLVDWKYVRIYSIIAWLLLSVLNRARILIKKECFLMFLTRNSFVICRQIAIMLPIILNHYQFRFCGYIYMRYWLSSHYCAVS